jgi:hypothetical protein
MSYTYLGFLHIATINRNGSTFCNFDEVAQESAAYFVWYFFQYQKL